MKKLISMIIFAACAVMATTARAQAPGAGPTPEQQAIRQAIIQKIEAIKYRRLKADLQLDDATAQQFFKIYKPAEHEVQALVKQRNDLMKSLVMATNSNSSTTDVASMAEKVRSLNEQISNCEKQLDSDLRPILTPIQRAKLLVFEHQFAQRVREQTDARHLQNQQMRILRRQFRRQRLKALRQHWQDKKGTPGP